MIDKTGQKPASLTCPPVVDHIILEIPFILPDDKQSKGRLR